MLGNGRQFELERLGELEDRGLALGDPRQDRSPGRIRQRGKGDAQRIGRHHSFSIG